ncbi:MAG TPA: arginine deiminase-related protein [Gemmatimonadota bacterium]|nr:arginine deiminase-related protein [Gemmatimonadota bacterium]
MPARRVLMIEPIGFRSNPETAADNAFQRPPGDESPQALEIAAREEFSRLRKALASRGVEVEWRPAAADRESPDAVFPNNWFSTHQGGKLVLYPMMAPSRRRERREEILDSLRERYPEILDLTSHEANDLFLEGTGSLVIDEEARIVYASESPRTDRRLVHEWAERMGIEPIVFHAADGGGRPIYHTNVVMSVGSEWAVVCADAIDPLDRSEVLASLAETGHETLFISLDQMEAFCGNVLELANDRDEKLVVMSDRAFQAFTDEQRATLENHAELVHVDLATIETHGGGSARCMIAELY